MRSTLARRALALFLLPAALITITVALVYGTVQQVYRTSANDPQLQAATEAAHWLDTGVSPRAVTGMGSVDLAWSLATHVSVYDPRGRVLASTARLGGAVPVPPIGVLDTARSQGKNVLTWQPETGVRVAAVVVPWHGGTVLVGRSLGPIEDRETVLELFALAAWIVGLGASAVVAYVVAWLWPVAELAQAT